jgi:Ca2+-binding EF-hand superfamily protein
MNMSIAHTEIKGELREAFQLLDVERKGYLTKKELKVVQCYQVAVRAFGLNVHKDEIENVGKGCKIRVI